MGLSKELVLAALQQQGIKYEEYDHEPVMTCDAQATALQGTSGNVTKNLFLRDKKRRQYLITALPDTKVDLKVLSARLGCGKSGLSWSSEELLAESLQVEPGCVTPLALANQSSSKHVLLLIDQKLKNTKFFVHPIVNSASVLLDSAGLDTFVRSVGREPIYVDLEADPKIDRDNPPDLKQYADNIGAPTKENEEGTSNNSSSGAASSQANIAAAPAAKTASQASTATAASKGKKTTSSKTANAVQQSSAEQHIQLSDVVKRTEDLINMVSQALLSNPAAEAAASNDYVLKRLKADVQMQLTAFKNAAYSAGYTAGKEEIVAFATRRYA